MDAVFGLALDRHGLVISPEPGSPLPWEGSYGGVNSGNGNKLTSLNLFSWKTRGGMTVDFTLFHNSQTSYNDELGHGWTWTYDMYINHSGATATVHHGDGTCIPFNDPDFEPSAEVDPMDTLYASVVPFAPSVTDNPFDAPTGIFDDLVQHGDDTWTLTKKDQTKLHFNDEGFLTEIEDKNGNTITITLNAYCYATRVTDATGRYYEIDLDGSNNFESVTSPDGEVWTFTRDGSDDLTEVEWPELDSTSYSDTFAYSSHRIATHTDKRGKAWTNTYNLDGSLATAKNPYNHTWTYSYASTYSKVANPLSKEVRHNYSSGKLASIVDEASYSVSQTLGAVNLPTSVVDKRGKTWAYTYDSKGNVLTKTNPLSKVWEYTYDGDNNLLTAEDPLGNLTEYTYDANGNLETVEDPLNRDTATNDYDAYGQLISVTNALTKVTEFGYDADGNLETIEDPLTHVITMDYDVMSRLTSTTDALSNVESVAYDEWGRPVTYTHPGSLTSLVVYDAEGNTTAATNELNKTSNYAYDDAGRLTSVTNAKSEVESYAYNNAGQRTSITNGRNKTRTYTYTDRGEVATLTLADSSAEAWSYNGSGATTAYTNPLSQVIYYTFDDAGRQTAIDYPAGTDVAFSYDDSNRRTQMTDSTGTTGWSYNAASELTGFNSPQGNLTYTYTTAGQRYTMVDGGLTTTYTYNDAGRLTSLQNGYSETTGFTYDNANRLTKKTYSSGQYEDYAYDSRSRVTSVTLKNSSNATLRTNAYTYDNASRVATNTLDAVTTTFGYDDIGQLTSESRSGYSGSYTYDANGNRATRTVGGVTENYAYDDADKLQDVKIGGVTQKSYGYDTAGRTTSVVSGAGTTTLAYDYEGRISTITYPSTATNTFTYNGLDTRVSKVDSAGTSTYKRDGAGVTAPVLGDGSAVYTPGVSERRSSTTTFLHSGLKNADSQTGTGQTIGATKQYDAFGNVLSATGTWKGPFGYAGSFGYQEDADSSLKLLGHRYYDASTGRFLTRDPVGDGRNWYTYASNNPISRSDPSGLFTVGGFEFTLESVGQGLATAGAGLVTVVQNTFVGLYKVSNPITFFMPDAWMPYSDGGSFKDNPGFRESTILWDIAQMALTAAAGIKAGPGAGACFVEGTPVLMADGTFKPIEQVSPNDRVVTRNDKEDQSASTSHSIVSNTFVRRGQATIFVRFQNGDKVETTANHPFFVEGRGFCQAGQLKKGDKVATAEKRPLIVDEVLGTGKFRTVFNFEVKGDHTYFVGTGSTSAWVHNECIHENHILPTAVREKLNPSVVPPGAASETMPVPAGTHTGPGGFHSGKGYGKPGGHWNNWYWDKIDEAGGLDNITSQQQVRDLMDELSGHFNWPPD